MGWIWILIASVPDLCILLPLKLYSPNSFPLLQMTPLILPTVSFAAEKITFMVMVLPLVLFSVNDCAIDRTGSSSNSNMVYN